MIMELLLNNVYTNRVSFKQLKAGPPLYANTECFVTYQIIEIC